MDISEIVNNWEDIFYITEEDGKFYAVFKHNDKKLNNISPCKYKVYAESLAYNWCYQPINQKEIIDIMMELAICD